MAGNKNQHIIPQHYLRGFSKDRDNEKIKNSDKTIYYFNKNSENLEYTTINNLPKDSYFFGKGIGFDDVNKAFEAEHAPILKDLIKDRSLQLDPDKQEVLYTFIMLLYVRTKKARELAVETIETLHADITKDTTSVDEVETHSEMMITIMASFLSHLDVIKDLSQVLIINESGRHFIISDNPVIFHNYLKVKNKSITYLQASGLLICCPLSEDLSLLFFDKEMYNICKDNLDTITVKNEKDIDLINKLQLINCYEQIYCYDSGELDYIKKLKSSVKYHIMNREHGKIRHEKYANPNTPNIETNILYIEDISYKIKPSFIEFNEENKKIYKEMNTERDKTGNPSPITRMEFSSYRDSTTI